MFPRPADKIKIFDFIKANELQVETLISKSFVKYSKKLLDSRKESSGRRPSMKAEKTKTVYPIDFDTKESWLKTTIFSILFSIILASTLTMSIL